MTRTVEILPYGNDIFSLHSQYHACWWSGNAKNQGISTHDIALVILGYFGGFSTRMVNSSLKAENWHDADFFVRATPGIASFDKVGTMAALCFHWESRRYCNFECVNKKNIYIHLYLGHHSVKISNIGLVKGYDVKPLSHRELTHSPLDKMDATWQTAFSNVFSSMKIFVFWF